MDLVTGLNGFTPFDNDLEKVLSENKVTSTEVTRRIKGGERVLGNIRKPQEPKKC